MYYTDDIKKIIRNNSNKFPNIHIGMLVRRARKSKGYTLGRVSEDICCVSYLSKLENGQMEATPKILEEVVKKLEIDRILLRTVKEYQEITDNLLLGMNERDYSKVKEAFDSILPYDEVHYADVIRLGYYIFNKEVDKSKKAIEKILRVKEYLIDYEVIILCLLIGEFSMQIDDYYEAHRSLGLMNSFGITNENVKEMYYRACIECEITLGHYSTALRFIDEYSKVLALTNNYVDIQFVQNNRCIVYAMQGDISYSRYLLSKSNNKWFSAIINMIEGKTSLEIDGLDKRQELLYSIYNYDKYQKREEVLELLNDFKPENERENIYKQALQKKYSDDSVIYRTYLKDKVLPYFINSGRFYEVLYYGKELANILCMVNSYKDASKTLWSIIEMAYKGFN